MILLKNGTLYTMEEEGILSRCDLLIEEGKIAAIGQDLACPTAETIDATGLHVLPGLVDGHFHGGGFDMALRSDVNENSGPMAPQLQVFYSIDVRDPGFRLACKSGVTTVCIAPGSSNVIGGVCITTKTYGDSLYDMVLQNPAAMKCAMAQPKTYGGSGKAPASRMALAAMLREALRKAREYQEKQSAAEEESKWPPYDAQCEALLPVLRREIPIKVHCQLKPFDMLTVIEISKEFDIRYTLDHGFAADRFLEEIYEGGGHLFYGPIGIPTGGPEVRAGSDIIEVKRLEERGIPISLITDAPVYSAEILLFSAGEAVRVGIPHQRALRMITLSPAQGLGLDHRIGSLKVGKDADLAI
ncbi:MAG: amidohydrolase family protein, partial [Symbiobacteriaceae bacterium]|nr:amidohydrolase family protein [Symbiobacteriaceae bacterium]